VDALIMSIEKKFEFEKIFKIENPTVEETQHWAIDVAQIDIEHLRYVIYAFLYRHIMKRILQNAVNLLKMVKVIPSLTRKGCHC